jgi:hypothetical protein
MTICALCGADAPLLAPLHYCTDCVTWLVDEHGPIQLDPGDPEPAWMDGVIAHGDDPLPGFAPDSSAAYAPLMGGVG